MGAAAVMVREKKKVRTKRTVSRLAVETLFCILTT
jgi:hypothetical protein